MLSHRLIKTFAVLAVVFLASSLVVSAADCNGNGDEDQQDIEGGFSEDCNQNDIPDECDLDPVGFGSEGEDYPVAKVPRLLKSGDLDGDGDLDLVIGSLNTDLTSSVSVLLNAGDGTFSPAGTFAAGENLSGMTVDDLDDDGDLDVASASGRQVLIFLNSGDAAFEAPTVYTFDETVSFVTSGDMTGDGFADLVIAQPAVDTVSVLENQGAGSFGAQHPLAVGETPIAISAADLNADGDLDLAVLDQDSGRVSVLLRSGGGVFLTPREFDGGTTRPFTLLSGDFDDDGDVDLATGGTSSAAVLSNDGAGQFSGVGVFGWFGRANALVAADIERDGDLDLVVGFLRLEKIVLIRNGGGAPFRAAVEDKGDIPNSNSISAQDFDGDGDFDLALVTRNVVTVRLNTENETGHLAFLADRHSTIGEPHTVALGDVDGDRDLDVVTGNNFEGMTVLKNQGNGAFAAPERKTFRSSSFSIILRDLDGDGDLDLASADPPGDCLQILKNDGGGSFEALRGHPVGDSPVHVAAGDLNEDGSVDLITANESAGTITLLFNEGDGTFSLREDLAVGSGPRAAATSDLNRDGHLDIAVANRGSSEICIFFNIVGGNRQAEILPVPGQPTFVVSADLDVDGHEELITANESNRTVAIFWNRGRDDGSASFDEAMIVPIEDSPFSLITADIDGDRDLEIMTANLTSDTVSTLLNLGSRSFQLASPIRVGSQPRFVAAGDLDGDGDLDVVSANHGSRDISLLVNQMSSVAGNYLEKICTVADFHKVSVTSSAGGLLSRVAKYVLPARDDPDLLPSVYQDARLFPLHQEFLAATFPERFPTLTGSEYDRLVGRRETRDYYVGTVSRIKTEGVVYAFTVVADTGSDVGELLRLEEIEYVYETLKESFTLEPLAYWPDTELAKRRAESWPNPPFEVFFDDGSGGVEYEAYTLATGYGRVRLMTLEEFNEANERGRFTFQDVVVVAEAPRDIEGVVGGVITGTIQGTLSHVAIRTARRGTPNAYVQDALAKFAPYEGQLVRLQVFSSEYFVEPATNEAAQEFWSANRPELPELPEFDPTYGDLDRLSELDLTGAGGASPVGRFGGKATNLARLQGVLTGEFDEYREVGFAIPMRYYLEFMAGNTLSVENREQSYQEYLTELLSDADFESDSELRSESLAGFRDVAREEGVVDPELVSRLAARIEEVYGTTRRMVRFRSSSNVEDALEFNGAGLYESTSVCAADTLDGASPESSHCDPSREGERTIERALKKVWTSLWTFRAHEERTFFQIPPESAAMGILVNRAFLDERANGVAFTGNPQNTADKRYVISAQLGEASVVSPDPGTTVERNLLEVEEGEVVRIIRARSSSLVAPGETVLSDDQLRELGRFMAHVDGRFPLDLEGHRREQVLLDFEFKIEAEGSLAVKQVRPFLIPDTAPRSPTFELAIPDGTAVCGVFSAERTGRSPREEYETKSVVRFVAGTYQLPTGSDTLSADLIESVLFGPEQQRAEPVDRGLFRIRRLASGSETTYRFDYEQHFVLPSGESFKIELFDLQFRGRGEVAIDPTLLLDDQFLTFSFSMQGALDDQPRVSYSSCSYQLLPHWQLEVEAEGGSFLQLNERFLPSENNVSTGPASLTRGEIVLGGTRRVVTDYWSLVYAARRHNRDVRYWVILDPPLEVLSVESPIHAVEFVAPDTVTGAQASLSYLGVDFEVLATADVTRHNKREASAETSFRRGDVNADGAANVTDVLALLDYLFRRGAAPSCRKSADANDDGKLNVADAAGLLLHLFAGRGPLPPPIECSVDPTGDALDCASYTACE